jgi:acylphosphatase
MAAITERLLVTGLVQGVGFRAFVAREAERLGLWGWVRNRGFDEVEAVLQGEAARLEILIELARRGPPGAQVHSVKREPAGLDLARLAGGARGCVVLPSV